ncbi:hypothetical protein BH11BAC5_BH11BAC5_23790 [soil metagenome]
MAAYKRRLLLQMMLCTFIDVVKQYKDFKKIIL